MQPRSWTLPIACFLILEGIWDSSLHFKKTENKPKEEHFSQLKIICGNITLMFTIILWSIVSINHKPPLIICSNNLLLVLTWVYLTSLFNPSITFSVASGNADPVVTNSLKLFLSHKMFLSHLIIMITFLAIVVWSGICLLSEFVELVVMGLPLYATWLYSVAALNILSSFCPFSILIFMWHETFFSGLVYLFLCMPLIPGWLSFSLDLGIFNHL